jgi:phenylpyruvate tautomerase
MPLLKLQVNVSVVQAKQAELLAGMSKLVAHATGKPEPYVMVTLAEGPILMSGKDGPAAFADVRSIGGLDGRVNREISQNLCVLLNKTLGIPASRVYLNFADIAPGSWGHNGSTFG